MAEQWWTLRRWSSVRHYLLRAIGHTKFDDDLRHPWVIPFIKLASRFWRGMTTRDGRALTKKVLTALCENDEYLKAYEAVYALHGFNRPTALWVKGLVIPKKEPITPDERARRAREAVAAKARRREAHAREMLAKHEKKLAIEKRAVARWRAKVARYDRVKTTRTYTKARLPGRPVNALGGQTYRGAPPGPQNASQGRARGGAPTVQPEVSALMRSPATRPSGPAFQTKVA